MPFPSASRKIGETNPNKNASEITDERRSEAFKLSLRVPERGLEPPRPITATWPSTMRVYQFRHSGRHY